MFWQKLQSGIYIKLTSFKQHVLPSFTHITVFLSKQWKSVGSNVYIQNILHFVFDIYSIITISKTKSVSFFKSFFKLHISVKHIQIVTLKECVHSCQFHLKIPVCELNLAFSSSWFGTLYLQANCMSLLIILIIHSLLRCSIWHVASPIGTSPSSNCHVTVPFLHISTMYVPIL